MATQKEIIITEENKLITKKCETGECYQSAENLPTSDPQRVGQIYVDNGILKVSAG